MARFVAAFILATIGACTIAVYDKRPIQVVHVDTLLVRDTTRTPAEQWALDIGTKMPGLLYRGHRTLNDTTVVVRYETATGRLFEQTSVYTRWNEWQTISKEDIK